MTQLWVFDAYGTLFDPQALSSLLDRRFPGRGDALATAWRETQLRYTWLRSLMDRWAPFDVVTADALRHALRSAEAPFDDAFLEEALTAYSTLPPYSEVADVLSALDGRAIILSNGTRDMLEAAATAAGLRQRFEAVLSSDEVRVYKPHPRIYGLVAERLSVPPDTVRFVSGNAWDCAGATAAGFGVIRVARTAARDEELGVAPPVRTLADLRGLPEA
ncbi:MAG: haloacid dehalogenase type II [Candidatus Limnocylindria bacterium]